MTAHGCLAAKAYQVAGNRAVVQVFEGTSGIDVKKVSEEHCVTLRGCI